MTRTAPILLALPLLLAACDGARQPVAEEAGAGAPTAAAIDGRHTDARVVVDANGLGARDGRPLRFGAARAEVDALVVTALGQPAGKSSNRECGAGPMDFTDIGPLQLAFQDGKFVGWFLNDGSGVTTSDGIAPGMRLADLKAERPVRVITDSTLNGEFEYQTADAGMITGFYKGTGDSGKIIALTAGLNCFFR